MCFVHEPQAGCKRVNDRMNEVSKSTVAAPTWYPTTWRPFTGGLNYAASTATEYEQENATTGVYSEVSDTHAAAARM